MADKNLNQSPPRRFCWSPNVPREQGMGTLVIEWTTTKYKPLSIQNLIMHLFSRPYLCNKFASTSRVYSLVLFPLKKGILVLVQIVSSAQH